MIRLEGNPIGPALTAKVYASNAPAKPASTDASNLVWLASATAQTEINLAIASGANHIILSEGTFTLTGAITPFIENLVIEGQGRDLTTLSISGAVHGISHTTGYVYDVQIKGLTIDGTGQTLGSNYGINSDSAASIYLEDIKFANMKNVSAYINLNGSHSFESNRLYFTACSDRCVRVVNPATCIIRNTWLTGCTNPATSDIALIDLYAVDSSSHEGMILVDGVDIRGTTDTGDFSCFGIRAYTTNNCAVVIQNVFAYNNSSMVIIVQGPSTESTKPRTGRNIISSCHGFANSDAFLNGIYANNMQISDCSSVGWYGTPSEGAGQSEAFDFNNCDYVTVQNCSASHQNGAGITFYNCHHTKVIGSKFFNNGSNNANGDFEKVGGCIWASDGQDTDDIEFIDCLIYDNQATTADTLTGNAASGQAVVNVTDGTKFFPWQKVFIDDSAQAGEFGFVKSINSNAVTLWANLSATYTTANSATMIGVASQEWGVYEFVQGTGVITGTVVESCTFEGNNTAPVYFITTDARVRGSVGYLDTKGSSLIVVAASDSSVIEHSAANYITAASHAETTINTALVNCTTGVILTGGTFSITGSIIVPSGKILTGSGWNTKIYRTTSTYTSLLAEALDNSETGVDVDSGAEFIAGQTIRVGTEDMYISSIAANTLTVIRGHNGTTAATHADDSAILSNGPVIVNALSMEGTASAVTVKNLWIDAGDLDADVTQPSSTGIAIRKCNNSLVDGCWVQNTQGTHPTISDEDVLRGSGIAIDDSDYFTVRGNYVTLTSHGAISVRNNSNNGLVDGNYTFNSDYEGIVVCNKTYGSSATTGEGCSNIKIVNNTVYDSANSSCGIYVEDQATSGAGNPHYNITIANNTVCKVSSAAMSGILILRQSGTTAVDLNYIIDNNTVKGMDLTGIGCSYSPGGVVSNNSSNDNVGAAFSLTNSSNVTVIGNRFTGSTDGTNYGSGTSLTNSNNVKYQGNTISGNAKYALYVSACADLQVIGNEIRQPVNQRAVYIAGASSRPRIISNTISLDFQGAATNGHGIELASGATADDAIISENFIINTNAGDSSWNKGIATNCDRTAILNNKFLNTTVAKGWEYSIGAEANADATVIVGNQFTNGFYSATINNAGTNTVIRNNQGYLAPGEIRSATGALTGGAQNDILFSWHNPEAQDILVRKVVVNITTLDADAANIDCGIADSATYTNGGTEFFNDMAGETAQLNDSWVSGDGGTQTKWVLCQDSASATDGWVVAKILDADGTSIVGSYYIEFVGK